MDTQLAALFRRDLTRLVQELQALPEEALWRTLPGVSNPVGNLALHLEGNLREFIGRQLGRVPYQRVRETEFAGQDTARDALIARLEEVARTIPEIVAGLAPGAWEATYPEKIWGAPIATRQFVLSLYGHLNYHLGQIDYLRRILTGGKAIEFAGLIR